MSALKPSKRSKVSVFNKARVLGEFPLFYSTVKGVLNCGQYDPLIQGCSGFDTQKKQSETEFFLLFTQWSTFNEKHAAVVFLFCLIHGQNRGIFRFLRLPLPVRSKNHGLFAANGILFWAPTKLFSPSSILQEEPPDT